MKAPIPTKAAPTSVQLDDYQKSEYPSIEQFVNDCFLHSSHRLSDSSKIKLIENFQKHAKNTHSFENLQFLVDIFAYEELYNSHFNLINRLNTPSPSRGSTPSRSSSVLTNHPKQDELVFIDDISDENPWDSLKDKNVSLTDSEDDADSLELSDEAKAHLDSSWKNIMTDFIQPDSKLQINLSDKAFTEIMAEDKHDRVHDPLVLLSSKNEVIQLLNENVYHNFIKKLKNCSNQQCDPTCSMGKSRCCSASKPSPKCAGKDYSTYIKESTKECLMCDTTSLPPSPCLSPISSKRKSNSTSSTSSLTNILGHLKLNTHAFSASPLSSSFNSLSSSPDEKNLTSKFKLWSKKTTENKSA